MAAVLLTAVFAFRLLYLFLHKGRRRRWITWLVVLLWTSSACPWLYITAKAHDAAGEEQKYPAPDALLTLQNGQRVHLSDLRGKIVLLDFWATWCAPCRASEPALNNLSRKSLAKGFVLARISGDEDTAKWRRYVLNHPGDALEALDTDSYAATAFQV